MLVCPKCQAQNAAQCNFFAARAATVLTVLRTVSNTLRS